MTSKLRSQIVLTVILLGMCATGIAIGFIAYSVSIPTGSPIAQMNRTEAGLTALMTALRTYESDFGAYPPVGQAGLRLATKHLSQHVNYMPGDSALDAWGHPFVYVPSPDYKTPGSGALEQHGDYFAPDSYQLYSIGMDADAGEESIEHRADNITSWEADRPWRKTYKRRHQEYFLRHGTKQDR